MFAKKIAAIIVYWQWLWRDTVMHPGVYLIYLTSWGTLGPFRKATLSLNCNERYVIYCMYTLLDFTRRRDCKASHPKSSIGRRKQ